jgi:hypothetical protein
MLSSLKFHSRENINGIWVNGKKQEAATVTAIWQRARKLSPN